MRTFLWKGIVRDRSRSLLPVIVVTLGVFFVIFLDGIIGGMMDNMVEMSAKYQTGHLKVMTRAYYENQDQKPTDLAILDVDQLIDKLQQQFPEVDWNPRISFGGLLDIPDAEGETRAQGPVTATAYDLLSSGNSEVPRLQLEKSITAGHTIQHPGEIILSHDFSERFHVQPGDTVTFFGSTMEGAMTFANYTVAGIIRFGVGALDKGAIIIDLADARLLLDMNNAAGEIYGYLPNEQYDGEKAEEIKNTFNAEYENDPDEYAPVMLELADQNGMRSTLAYASSISVIMVILLVLALSIVLWNTGVLGGIRRYNEFGIRLAMGEEKGHIYRSLLTESLFIGLIGSFLGTVLGLSLSLYLHQYGIDYGAMMDNINMMFDPVVRSRITPRMYYIGFIPGVASMLIGSALAGIAVYKRKTAQLFKELE